NGFILFVLPIGFGRIWGYLHNPSNMPCTAYWGVVQITPLSATQKGEAGLKPRPHGFMRFASVNRGTPAMSETRFTRVYTWSPSCPPGLAAVPHNRVKSVTNNMHGHFMVFLLQKMFCLAVNS